VPRTKKTTRKREVRLYARGKTHGKGKEKIEKPKKKKKKKLEVEKKGHTWKKKTGFQKRSSAKGGGGRTKRAPGRKEKERIMAEDKRKKIAFVKEKSSNAGPGGEIIV